jgi:hypothetical protein
VNKDLVDHPVLRGVDDIWGPSDVYGIKRLESSAKVLLKGQILSGMKPSDVAVEDKRNRPMMPLAWIKGYQTKNGKSAKVFCTTMGAATDLESEDLRRLLVNAAYWSVGLESKITDNLNVSYIDSYTPSKFGFGSFQKGRKPSFYDLKAEK